MYRRLAAVALLAVLCAAGPALAQQVDSLRVDLGAVPDFSLTERSGQTVRRADLLGKVWVAAFFFIECADGCPKLSKGMQRLQKDLAGVKDVVLVSFSVNPESDTPQKLRDYANDYGADPRRWLFLTGEEKAMYRLIEKGFYQAVVKLKDADPALAVDHTFRMLVVGPKGRIRGYLGDGRKPQEVARLGERVKELVRERDTPPAPVARVVGPLPAVNAVLNGSCALLLIVGYVAIRRRHIGLHKTCMLSALAVSTLFLMSYLYYHFIVLDGKPTRFSGQGGVQAIYFAVLLSHTLLATAVAPLAVITTLLGLRDRLERHKRLARLTLPLWLYVSVTGVVVYWMLYHLYPPA